MVAIVGAAVYAAATGTVLKSNNYFQRQLTQKVVHDRAILTMQSNRKSCILSVEW